MSETTFSLRAIRAPSITTKNNSTPFWSFRYSVVHSDRHSPYLYSSVTRLPTPRPLFLASVALFHLMVVKKRPETTLPTLLVMRQGFHLLVAPPRKKQVWSLTPEAAVSVSERPLCCLKRDSESFLSPPTTNTRGPLRADA